MTAKFSAFHHIIHCKQSNYFALTHKWLITFMRTGNEEPAIPLPGLPAPARREARRRSRCRASMNKDWPPGGGVR